MKKLSLLMCTILILGCGTDTEVVEEPEEPPPVVMELKNPLQSPANCKGHRETRTG